MNTVQGGKLGSSSRQCKVLWLFSAQRTIFSIVAPVIRQLKQTHTWGSEVAPLSSVTRQRVVSTWAAPSGLTALLSPVRRAAGRNKAKDVKGIIGGQKINMVNFINKKQKETETSSYLSLIICLDCFDNLSISASSEPGSYHRRDMTLETHLHSSRRCGKACRRIRSVYTSTLWIRAEVNVKG